MLVADASWVIAVQDPYNLHHNTAVSFAPRMIGALLHPITLAECLVSAARLGSVYDTESELRDTFDVPEVDHGAPARWAILRADTALKLPDAIVLDTALHHQASAIATFDSRLAIAARSHNLEVLGAP